MKITIKEKEYTIKYTLRALFIYEQITGKVFKMETITDQYIFIYCLILANVPDVDLNFDDFINECDNDPKLIANFQMFISKEMEKQTAFLKEIADENSKKKN